MKVLALGDPHGKLPVGLDGIIKKNGIELREIVKKLCSYGLPVIALRGNTYRSDRGSKITKSIFDKYDNLIHKLIGKINIKGKTFVLFDVLFEKESAVRKNLFGMENKIDNKKLEKKLDELLVNNPRVVLVCHNPPYGYLDELDSPCMPKELNGKHVGSKILLRAIRKHQPRLVLCGHIHEAKGRTKIGKTDVINLGYRGDYEILDL